MFVWKVRRDDVVYNTTINTCASEGAWRTWDLHKLSVWGCWTTAQVSTFQVSKRSGALDFGSWFLYHTTIYYNILQPNTDSDGRFPSIIVISGDTWETSVMEVPSVCTIDFCFFIHKGHVLQLFETMATDRGKSGTLSPSLSTFNGAPRIMQQFPLIFLMAFTQTIANQSWLELGSHAAPTKHILMAWKTVEVIDGQWILASSLEQVQHADILGQERQV